MPNFANEHPVSAMISTKWNSLLHINHFPSIYFRHIIEWLENMIISIYEVIKNNKNEDFAKNM